MHFKSSLLINDSSAALLVYHNHGRRCLMQGKQFRFSLTIAEPCIYSWTRVVQYACTRVGPNSIKQSLRDGRPKGTEGGSMLHLRLPIDNPNEYYLLDDQFFQIKQRHLRVRKVFIHFCLVPRILGLGWVGRSPMESSSSVWSNGVLRAKSRASREYVVTIIKRPAQLACFCTPIMASFSEVFCRGR